MLEYKLTKGEGTDSDTVKLNEYLIGELYTVKPEVGYFVKNDMRIGFNDYIPWSKIEQKPGKGKKIIVKCSYRPNGELSLGAIEFLTNRLLDVIYIAPHKLIFNRANACSYKTYNAFVYLREGLKNPTTEEMWNYILEHENVEQYYEELNAIISNSEMYCNKKLELENIENNKNKLLIKKIR